jgi:hypothetical protein
MLSFGLTSASTLLENVLTFRVDYACPMRGSLRFISIALFIVDGSRDETVIHSFSFWQVSLCIFFSFISLFHSALDLCYHFV